jgi:hypothetical protein
MEFILSGDSLKRQRIVIFGISTRNVQHLLLWQEKSGWAWSVVAVAPLSGLFTEWQQHWMGKSTWYVEHSAVIQTVRVHLPGTYLSLRNARMVRSWK